uniref:Thioredoxin-like fold domain-containing protein n=1 Tax=Chromera velia CCMP2878 TaxID=1169474 RepID=A0A0G4HXI2_9ALVE|mmetsp:Transcript_54074/g.105806  ORF Transcript_54074/g.105806 Transcript_54074/m.105806 type:complete len:266 (-) Transcript_54074:287-1084(-)|eukprot:Cvel_1498.t1-p1 / transcript=Cvel_1498.t1 / gene=Cvel_1498 / organism=Chromera_velia_CCMP2878 / gene_product=hypothetical protein / transcript_product=hypothetical protein / location=Cvel_scaffold52:111295-114233(+) / protein_length=265 / sequence_SO=supercontig / SO=protein_coding / is_pseudo=false
MVRLQLASVAVVFLLLLHSSHAYLSLRPTGNPQRWARQVPSFRSDNSRPATALPLTIERLHFTAKGENTAEAILAERIKSSSKPYVCVIFGTSWDQESKNLYEALKRIEDPSFEVLRVSLDNSMVAALDGTAVRKRKNLEMNLKKVRHDERVLKMMLDRNINNHFPGRKIPQLMIHKKGEAVPFMSIPHADAHTLKKEMHIWVRTGELPYAKLDPSSLPPEVLKLCKLLAVKVDAANEEFKSSIPDHGWVIRRAKYGLTRAALKN